MARPLTVAAVALAAGCAGAAAPAPAWRDVEISGHEFEGPFREIPAGEFEFEGRRVYLPTFWIQVARPQFDVHSHQAAPPSGLHVADDAELAKALAPRYGLAPEGGRARLVRRIESSTAPAVAWRPEFWDAVDEARRRNCVLFVTCHWDGCGNCDRFRQKIVTDPRFVAYVNAHVVPVAGHRPHPEFPAHAPLPDGRCWVYPGVTCEEHQAAFDVALDAMHWFPMSPGHAVLSPRAGPTADREEFVMVGDEALPDEGTVEFWIDTFQAEQGKLGPHWTADAYAAARDAFESADSEALRAIAADPEAPFRDDARRRLEGDPDAARVDAAEADWVHGWTAEAIAALADARGVRAHRLRTEIERRVWELLTRARCCDDSDERRATYALVAREFVGLAAATVASEEMAR